MKLVEFQNVCKKFPMTYSAQRKMGLRHFASNVLNMPVNETELRKNEFWALKDVSFSVSRGESIGLIGVNGAGKSTLLKHINGLLLPTVGSINVKGKVESLIELGTGFHRTLTGRENIKIRCAINGMSEEQTESILDEIIEFSELEDFIDLPVENYSSGMFTRLGFSAAVHGKPDVLLLDEVLSVGDFGFRQKCLHKINSMKEDCAVLFVSHSMNTIRRFCNRAIVLDKGQVLFQGTVDESVEFVSNLEKKDKIKLNDDIGIKEHVHGPSYTNKDKIENINFEWHQTEDELRLNFSCKLLVDLQDYLFVGIPFWNAEDELITAFNSDLSDVRFKVGPTGEVSGSLVMPSFLKPGSYRAAIAIHDGPEYLHREILPLLKVPGVDPRKMGSVVIPHSWEIN